MKAMRRLSYLAAMALALAPGTRLSAEAEKPEDTDKPEARKGDKKELPTYSEVMVVTASRTEESVADAPVAVTVVEAEVLENSPATNVAEALRGVPGLNIIQTSARDFNFTQRGATSTLAAGQLALLDGRSIYQDFYGFVMWDVLPVSLDEIAQVEVVRGPASAVWGANAFNGVVNVRTKSPREIAGAELMFGGGEVGTWQGSARWAAAPNERWSYKLSAGYVRQDPWERRTTLPSGAPLPAGTAFQNEGTKQPKFDVRVDYEPNADSRWSFRGGAALTSGLIHTGIGPFSVDDKTYMGFGQVSYNRKGFEGRVYMNRLDGEATNVINTLPFSFEQSTWVADLTQRVAWGEQQTLVFGASGRLNRFDLSIAPREDQRNEAGAFLEDQIRLSDMVKLTLGARVDWFDTIGTTFSPRTSLVLKPQSNVSFRVAYNRAFRSPSLVNNFLETAVPNVILLPAPVNRPFTFLTGAVGNADLDEEKIDAFEAGVTWTVLEKATFTVSAYRNEIKNNIDFYPAEFYSAADPPAGWPLPPAFVPPNTLPKTFSYRNIGKIVDKGVEVSADYRFAPGWSSSATYAFQDESEVTDIFGVNLPPRHAVSFAVNANQPGWFGSIALSYVDEAFWADVLDQRFWGSTPAWTTVSGGFGLKFQDGRYVLAVNVTNLTDRRYQQHIFGDILRRRVTGEARIKM